MLYVPLVSISPKIWRHFFQNMQSVKLVIKKSLSIESFKYNIRKTYITCLKMLDMSIQGEPICCLGIAKPRQLKNCCWFCCVMRKCTLDMRITKLAVIERIDFGIQDLDFCDLLRSKFKISHRETNRSFCLSLEFQLGS